MLALYDEDVKKGGVPDLFQAVGFSDFLYKSNLEVRDYLLERKANLKFVEGEGGHNWDFWDGHICEILDWFLQK